MSVNIHRNDVAGLQQQVKDLTHQLAQIEKNHARELRLAEANQFMSQVQTVDAIVEAIEAKDEYTSGHSRRVMELSLMVGAALRLDAARMWKLHIGALLHDVGKIGVLDLSLTKTTRLDDQEYLQLKAHPLIGERIVRKIDIFSEVAPVVRWHHERYDGKGYPDGLQGDQIPIESAIISIADTYDAITSKRAYNKPMTWAAALEEIERNSGTQFSPAAVAALKSAVAPNEVLSVHIDDSDFVGGLQIPDEIGI